MLDPMSPDPEVVALEQAWIAVENEQLGVVTVRGLIEHFRTALHAAGYRVVAAESETDCECGHRDADHYLTCGTCNHVPPYAAPTEEERQHETER